MRGWNSRNWVIASASAQMALQDAGFPADDELREQTGVLIGSGIGGLAMMSEQTRKLWFEGPGRVSPPMRFQYSTRLCKPFSLRLLARES